MFLGQPISLQPTVPGTSSSHQKLRDVLSNYQRETGQVWTKVGITPTTSSTQQCEEAIRGASLDDLRSVCLAAITTFNTLTQQLTALPNSVLEASIPTSTTKPLLGDLSHTTMAPDTVFSESNNNNNAALAVPLVSQMMKKENEGIDMLAETACPYVLPTRRKLSVSLNSFGVNWGGGGGDATTSPLRPKVPPTKTSPLRPTFVTADGLESSDNASGRKGPGSSKGSIFDGRKNRVYSQVRDRDASVASYTGRAPLQFTNNVATTDNDDGFTMINDYVILDELGSGSFGKVMLAFDTRDDKFVAIKGITKGPRLKNLDLQAVTDEVLNSLPMAERRRLQTIQSEIAVMKDLRHQNLVALHEVMDDPAHNQLYLVLQYVDDGVLANVGAGTMHPLVTSVTGLVSACRQIATGLEYLHRHRVLHRDLKPENVLVDTHGNVCIADFGVSESLANKHISENMGTILFTSPELLDLRTSTDANISGTEPIENSESGNLPRMNSMTLTTTAKRPSMDALTRALSIQSTSASDLPQKRMSRSSVCGAEKKYAPDMWALGVMIYYLLYMRLPFETVDSIRNCDVEYPDAESTSWWTDTTDRQTGNPFTAEQLAARRAMVPEMEKLLRRLLEKDPALRATANEARLALKAVARYIEDRSEEYHQQQEKTPPPPLAAEPSTSTTPPEGIFADMAELIETNSTAVAPSSTTSTRPFQPHYYPNASSTFPHQVGVAPTPTISALQQVVEPSIAQMESILNSVNNFRKQRGGQSSNMLTSSTSRRGSVQVPLLKSYKEGGGGSVVARPNNRNSVTTIGSPKNSFYGGGFGGFGGGEDIIDARLVAAGMRVSTRMASIFRQTHDALLRRKSSPSTNGSGCATTSMSGSPRPLHVSDLMTKEISSPASTPPLNLNPNLEDVPPPDTKQARSTSVTSVNNSNVMITPSPSLPTPNSIMNTHSIFTPPSSRIQQNSSSSYTTANKFTTANAQFREQQLQQQKGNHPTAFISRIKRVSRELDADVPKGEDQEENEHRRPNKFNDIREVPSSPLIALTHKPPSSPILKQMKRGTGYVRTGPMVSSTSSGGSFNREDSSSSPYVLQNNKKA